MMNVAIFGSCVSRDTAEYISDMEVSSYVARQSATSLETPFGSVGLNISGLDSPFQLRMVLSDLDGTGLERTIADADSLDLVLVDLVDERRGFWRFEDGRSFTNSLEIEKCGLAKMAERQGARLIQFGTDDHFNKWCSGFTKLVDGLEKAALLDRTVLLDIEWAQAVDGSPHPKINQLASLSRYWRRVRRGWRDARRNISKGASFSETWEMFWKVEPTRTEDYANRASHANEMYKRYLTYAKSLIPNRVSRSSTQLRIDPNHKWGPQPFHYREKDYRSAVSSICDALR